MPDGVYVETQDLRTKAVQIRNVDFGNAPSEPVPPDALPLSATAVTNLNGNANYLYTCQEYGEREGDRLAETLNSVADTYDQVDAEVQASIEGAGPPPGPKVPNGNSMPAPAPPAPIGAPAGLDAGGYADVEATQKALSAGDNGTSLQNAAQEWIRNGNSLQASAQTFKEPIQNWEGDAAQQAYQKFNAYGDYLFKLGTSWHELAGEAMKISDKHIQALVNHTPVYQQYVELKAELVRAQTLGGGLAHQIGEKMADLQSQSDEIRETYASQANPDRIHAPDPPPSGAPTAPVTGNGTRQADTGNGANPLGAGGGSGEGSGGAPAGATPQGPETTPVSPMSAQQAGKSEGSPSGGSPSGGSPSGGSGSGGGAPGGGLPGGDIPKDLPTLPGDPSLQPAAFGAGGGGSGGGSGGGGGAPNMPLQPAVGGVAVGPGPSGGGAQGAGAPAAAGAGGAGMGGMGGGMAPMHGAHGQGGGKERKRTPGLSPDEEIYNEDRPWTEGYIGQLQRKAGQSNKDSS